MASQADLALQALQQGGAQEPSGTQADAALAAMNISPVVAQPPKENQSGVIGNFLKGIGKGVSDLVEAPVQTIVNGANYLNHALPGYNPKGAGSSYLDKQTKNLNDYIGNQEREYQANTPGSIAAGVGRFIPSVAAFSLTGGSSAAPEAAEASSALPRLANWGANIAKSTATGVTTQPVSEVNTNSDGTNDFMRQKGIQGAATAITTPIGAMIGSGISKVINPTIDASTRFLINNGITPTIGQIAGGTLGSLENKLTTVPLVGDLIKSAQKSTVDDFNRAAYNRVLNPLGQNADNLPIGQEGVLALKNKLSDAYNNLLPKLNFRADPQYQGEIQNLTKMVNNGNLPPEISTQFNNILKNEVNSRMTPAGTMDGTTFKQVENSLVPKIRGYMGGTENERQLGSALTEALTSLRGNLSRSNPASATELNAINTGYANYARVRGAASMQGTADGVFTPAQLSSAIRAQDKSAGKGDFATGQALMQDLSGAGKNMMTTYPDSGTAGRSLAAAIPTLAVGLSTHPVATLGGVLGAGVASIPYTSTGKKLAAAILANRPESAPAIANGIKQAAPAVGGALSPSAVQFMSQYLNRGP